MRHLILGSFSCILVGAIGTTGLHAQTPNSNSSDSSTSDTLDSPSELPTPTVVPSQGEISPFNLVSMAYQGFFKNQGIPSGESLLAAYQTESITAEDIVKGAVDSRRLPASTLDDSNYIAAVENQLNGLTSGINKR
jgi:hypothetical protein